MDNDTLTGEETTESGGSYIWVENVEFDDDLTIQQQTPSVTDLVSYDIIAENTNVYNSPTVVNDTSLEVTSSTDTEPSTDLERLEKTFKPKFVYRDKSTVSVIGTPMVLVATSQVEDPSTTRSKIQGDSTISRLITNEYGTIYEPLSFVYGLMKYNQEPFTEKEQRIVERWLTSPKLSSELQITNCDGDTYSYYGIFLGPLRWIKAGNEFVMCEFTFNVNGAYPFKHYKYTWSALDEGDHNLLEFYCSSDELEEYVYPVIMATATSKDYTSSYEIIQHTDGAKHFKISTKHNITIVADCLHNRVYEGIKVGNKIAESEQNKIYFEDLGWGDADTIYWPRILPGWNAIEIKGNVVLEISYYAPYKKVGGWLV